MGNIGSEFINGIIKNSESLLEKRKLGGVTIDSASGAIKNTAEEIAKKANELLGSTQKEIAQLRSENNLSAQTIAKLTSEKDTLELSSKAAKQEIDVLKAREFKIKQGKPKTLPNGNIETIKINKNGARMTTETLPDGRKISVTVETINGDIRKTTFNPATGKPVKTFTNTRGEDVIIEYDANGVFKKMTKVNNKKVRPKEPTVISTEILETKNGITKAQKTYSDGSYEIGEINTNGNILLNKNLYNSNKKLVKTTIYDTAYYTHAETIYNPETGKIVKYIAHVKNGSKIISECNEAGKVIKRTTIYPNGYKSIIRADKNEFGLYNLENPKMEMIYPKESKIKKSKIDFKSRFYPEKETLELRDGTNVILSDFDGNYNIYKVEICPKGTEGRRILTDRNEINGYLQEIGKANSDRYYYNNLEQFM